MCLFSCSFSENKAGEMEKEMSADNKTNTQKNVRSLSQRKTYLFDYLNPIVSKDKKTPSKISHPKAIGIWKVSNDQSPIQSTLSNGNDSIASIWVILAWPSIFKYDGTHITGHFFERNGTAIWMSQDDYYKFKTFWRGDSLFYLSAFHRNEFVAAFRDTAFLNTETYKDTIEHTWIYEKISPKMLPKNSPILKERAAFDYQLIQSNN